MKKIIRLTEGDLIRLIKRVINEGEDDRINKELERINRGEASKMQLILYKKRLSRADDISELIELYNDVDNDMDIDEGVQERLLDSIYEKYVSLGGEIED